MAERYTRVFTQQGQYYCAGAPVVIEAGALLKDNQTGKIIAQIKYKNISKKAIRALSVKIHAKDVTGVEVKGVDSFQYLDLNVRRDEEFGAKIPIVLPDVVARSFSCDCVSAVFSDGTVWECEEDAVWTVLPAPVLLKNEIGAGLAEQYKRDTQNKSEYKVTEYADLWYCACGATNSMTEEYCHTCRAKKATLLAALNIEALRANKKKYDDAVATRQAEIEAEKQRRTKMNKKIGIIAVAAVATLITLVLIITKVVIPAIDYKNANALLSNGEFIAAEEAFGALGDYKDSQTMVLECQYQRALSQIESRNYDDAYEILRGLAGYKDSSYQIRNSIFQRAKDHIEHKEYETAYNLLENIDNDPEAQEIILEGKLREANDYIQAGDYDRGYVILNSLGQGDKVNENIYQRAAVALTAKEYDLAYTLFASLGDYEESKTKALEARYQKACDLLMDKNYDEANPIFEELGNYKDSKDKIHYHNYQVTDSKSANCTTGGYSTYYCEGCQNEYTEQLDALGHSYSGATCTKASVCIRCGVQEKGALGHTTSTGVCSRCKADFRTTYTFTGIGPDTYSRHRYVYLPDDFFTGAYTVSVSGADVTTFGIFDQNNKCIDSTWGHKTIYGYKRFCYISVEALDWDNQWTLTVAPAK